MIGPEEAIGNFPAVLYIYYYHPFFYSCWYNYGVGLGLFGWLVTAQHSKYYSRAHQTHPLYTHMLEVQDHLGSISKKNSRCIEHSRDSRIEEVKRDGTDSLQNIGVLWSV